MGIGWYCYIQAGLFSYCVCQVIVTCAPAGQRYFTVKMYVGYQPCYPPGRRSKQRGGNCFSRNAPGQKADYFGFGEYGASAGKVGNIRLR